MTRIREKIMAILYVGLGGAIGSIGRYLIMGWIGRLVGMHFPYATLAVNIVGSLLMGALVDVLARTLPVHAPELRLCIAVGFLGGFTTFSAFSLDVVTLMQEGHAAAALLYIVASVALCVFALLAGVALARMMFA